MKKFLQWLFPPDWLDVAVEEESKFINDNKANAEENLKACGWQILSKDCRVFFYRYRIQKDSQIHEVSIREALKIK